MEQVGHKKPRWRKDVCRVDGKDNQAFADPVAAPVVSAVPAMSSTAKGKKLRAPLLSPDAVAQLTVQMADVETSLPAVLEQHGCAIVSGVASDEECAHLEGLFAQDLMDLVDFPAAQKAGGNVQQTAENLTKTVRAWPLGSMEILGKKNRCQLRGLPHGRFAWQCRLHQNVRRCYEVVHGTRELVSSCDNPFFAPPAQAEQHDNRYWPHVDHNLHDRRFFDEDGHAVGDWDVFQGLLYVWSSESTHASTTVVLPGSHRDTYVAMMRDPSMTKQGQKGKHFCSLDYLSQADIARSLHEEWVVGARRVPVPKGGLFLWSSKTLHQGWTGGRAWHSQCVGSLLGEETSKLWIENCDWQHLASQARIGEVLVFLTIW